MTAPTASPERHPGWTDEGHKWLDAGAPLGSTASPAKDGEGRGMGCTEEDFLVAIHEKTPNGEWISVQHHPNGDWSVAAEPDATPSLLDKAEAALGNAADWAEKRKELEMWTGSAWLAGEEDIDRRGELYTFLCGLLGWLHAGEDAAAEIERERGK
jgi:hypothetical protein